MLNFGVFARIHCGSELKQPFLFVDRFCVAGIGRIQRFGFANSLLVVVATSTGRCVNASEHMQGWIRTTIEVPCFCLGQGCQRLAEQWCVKNITNCMGMGHVYSTASPAENAGSVQSTQAGL